MDPIDKFWDAVRALTYAEMQDVCGTLRDARDSAGYDLASLSDWMALLNSGREIHDCEPEEDAALAA